MSGLPQLPAGGLPQRHGDGAPRPGGSARGTRDLHHEDKTLQKMLAQKKSLEMLYHKTTPGASALHAGGGGKREGPAPDSVIDDFLQKCRGEEEGRATSPEASGAVQALAALPPPDSPSQGVAAGPRGAPSADRLVQEVIELKAKLASMSREKTKLKDQLTEKDMQCRRLTDELEQAKKREQEQHPTVARLRKLGMNPPALADLGERWAGYVLGRVSMAMEVGNQAFQKVFSAHSSNGLLGENTFKSVIRQFEPSIKSDQLTRLWFFADADSSGRVDLFEFMRMFGITANGDISDEYFDVLVRHLYKRFHSSGGPRYIWMTADKNQNRLLSLEEWMDFLTNASKVNMTKQEMTQLFHRMNKSGTGFLTVSELEETMESVASKCQVSEKWVRDTLAAFAMAVQQSGTAIKHMIPQKRVTLMQFRELFPKYVPSLRTSQLDRLWKYLQTEVSNDNPPRAHSEEWNHMDADSFAAAVFGPTLGAAADTGDKFENNLTVGRRGSIGRDMLDELASHLLSHVGDAKLDMCFEALDPFLTPEHFHDQLRTKFGLNYDVVKSKQLFGMIDTDRDGKVTRYEFLSLFGHTRIEKDCEDERRELHAKEVAGQTAKLLNRVQILEQELQRYTSHSRHGLLASELVPTVPWKQYQQLSVLHSKLMGSVQRMRPQQNANVQAEDKSPVSRTRSARTEPIEGTDSVEDASEEWDERNQKEIEAVKSRCETRLGEIVAQLKAAQKETVETFTARAEVLRQQTLTHREHAERLEEALLAMQRQEQAAATASTDRASAALAAPKQGSGAAAGPSGDESLQALEEEQDGSAGSAIEEATQMSPDGIQPNTRRSFTLPDAALARDKKAIPPPILTSPKELFNPRSPPTSLNPRSPPTSPEAPRVTYPRQPLTPLLKIVKQLGNVSTKTAYESNQDAVGATTPQWLSAESRHRAAVANLVGMILEDRYRVQEVKLATAQALTLECTDMALCRVVELRLIMEAEEAHAHVVELGVMATLADVPCVPDVYHFTSPAVALPFSIMELLQGQTLAARFQEAQESARPLSPAEAAEISFALLRGVDECHQRKVLHLGLHPETVWISPSLSRAPVRILDWRGAQIFKGSGVLSNPEFMVAQEGKWRGKMNALPKLVRGDVEIPVSVLLQSSKSHEKPFPKLRVQSHGLPLYYMSAEQLNSVIVAYEREDAKPLVAAWRWSSEQAGPAATIKDSEVHWIVKGDGLVQTNASVAVVPQGRLFEVEMRKVNMMVRIRGTSELGFRMGFTHLEPRGNRSSSVVAQEAWFVGGGCAYHRRGAVLPALAIRPVEREGGGAPPARAEGGGAAPAAAARDEDRYLFLPEGLRKDDRVALLVEWSGDLSVYVNGELVGRCPEVMEPHEVARPLYGLVDLYSRDGTEEHAVRVVSLCKRCKSAAFSSEAETKERQCMAELLRVNKLMHKPEGVAVGPPCDVYASARIVQQCFLGGGEVELPPAQIFFEVALAVWIIEGCPATERCHDLLMAIRKLQTDTHEDLSQIEFAPVQHVLSSALSRAGAGSQARISTCAEFAELLSKATGWAEMSSHFLSSHERALERTELRSSTEQHYQHAVARSPGTNRLGMMASQNSSGGSALSSPGWAPEAGAGGQLPEAADWFRLGETARLLQGGLAAVAAEGKRGVCLWDLRKHALGCLHIRRIVQVLASFGSIQAVALSRLSDQVSDDDQVEFLRSFSDRLGARAVPASAAGAGEEAADGEEHVEEALAERVQDEQANVEEGAVALPILLLDTVILPTKALPADTLPLQELLERRLLWLAPHAVEELDLEPRPPPGHKHGGPLLTLGTSPGAVPTLAGAIARSGLLTKLSLRSNEIGDKDGVRLAMAIRLCNSLRSVDLSNNMLKSEAAAAVVQAAEQCSNLTSLDLSRNLLGCEGATALAVPLMDCGSLTELNLACNGIGDTGAKELADSLLSNIALTELNLVQNKISLEAAGELVRATSATCALLVLRLDQNLPWPAYEGSEALVEQFAGHLGGWAQDHGIYAVSNLRTLSLRHCRVRSTAATMLWAALERNTNLRVLNMAWNGIGAASAVELAHYLATHTKLEEIDLRDNNLGLQDTLAISLQGAFGMTRSHTKFSRVVKNLMGQDRRAFRVNVMEALADKREDKQSQERSVAAGAGGQEAGARASLLQAPGSKPSALAAGGGDTYSFEKFNDKLRVLHLGNNKVASNGAYLLADALDAFSALQELYLYHNEDLGDAGAQAFARKLSASAPRRSSLRHLSLAVCGIGSLGGRALASALATNRSLVTLDLSCNAITAASTQAFGQALTCNNTLLTLNLAMNAISAEGVRDMVTGVAANTETAIRKIDVQHQSPKADQRRSSAAPPEHVDFGSAASEAVLRRFVGLP